MIEPINAWDDICNVCIYIMEHLSHITGLSYGCVNVILFVIFEPMAILLFMFSAVMLYLYIYRYKTTRALKVLSIISFVIGILFVLAIIIPITKAILTMPI